jgi:hypothetical protein
MSFLVTIALLIGLLVTVPAVAHLLRRGRAEETLFPPARLIPPREHVAKRRSRFEDRLLLSVRAALIVVLALLGATPLVRCDRAHLTRRDGASVAVVFVLDDSASMGNRLEGGISRFSRAKRAALELVDQLEEGDRMGLVLAGKPARVALLPTSNPDQLRQQLQAAKESDRGTDLVSAIALAESALDRQPESDKEVLVLSDLSGELPKLSQRVSQLLPELAAPARDCGVLSAVERRDEVSVEVACSSATPNSTGHLQLISEARTRIVLKEREISLRPGREVVALERGAGQESAYVRLVEKDDNPHDDRTPVTNGGYGPIIATYSDPITGRGVTGGPPILEQALHALNANLTLRPLSTVPEDTRELDSVEILLLDDPPLLSAESRATIDTFARHGGTAVAFFGPAANAAQLGSLLLPFIERRATWEPEAPPGLDPASLTTLGAAAASLADIAPKGRLVFDGTEEPKVVVRGRWADQRPFWLENSFGRGLVVTLGLPASIGQSDLALRSGFLSILEQILAQNERLGTGRITTVGKAWRFTKDAQLRVEGPSGPLLPDGLASPDPAEKQVVPTEVGRYRVTLDGIGEERVALFPAGEILDAPRPWPSTATNQPNKATGRLDISRWLVLCLMPLLLLELALSSTRLRGVPKRLRHWLSKGRLTRNGNGVA